MPGHFGIILSSRRRRRRRCRRTLGARQCFPGDCRQTQGFDLAAARMMSLLTELKMLLRDGFYKYAVPNGTRLSG
jgi:hypothetical protein